MAFKVTITGVNKFNNGGLEIVSKGEHQSKMTSFNVKTANGATATMLAWSNSVKMYLDPQFGATYLDEDEQQVANKELALTEPMMASMVNKQVNCTINFDDPSGPSVWLELESSRIPVSADFLSEFATATGDVAAVGHLIKAGVSAVDTDLED